MKFVYKTRTNKIKYADIQKKLKFNKDIVWLRTKKGKYQSK